LRSEISSGTCAKLRTVAASNNRDHPTRSLHRDHSIIACWRHIHVFLFFAHIPFVMNHTINATPPERLQQHQTQTRFCHFFAVSVSRWGRVLRLQVGKVAFACYSISSRSSLIRLAWEQYKLAQVLNSNLISE